MAIEWEKPPKVVRTVMLIDGRERHLTATESKGSMHRWDLEVRDPDGSKYTGTTQGSEYQALADAAALANRYSNEFREAKARGDRPKQQTYDHNRRVDEFGQSLAAPVKGYER